MEKRNAEMLHFYYSIINSLHSFSFELLTRVSFRFSLYERPFGFFYFKELKRKGEKFISFSYMRIVCFNCEFEASGRIRERW